MSMDLKNFFDLDKVNFTDSELELPYEESLISKDDIMQGMQKIMEISLYYCNPSLPDFEDWGAVHSIANTIYEGLKND